MGHTFCIEVGVPGGGGGAVTTKDFKNGSGPCLHGIHDEVRTTNITGRPWCQYNVTGWVSMWAYDMLSQ